MEIELELDERASEKDPQNGNSKTAQNIITNILSTNISQPPYQLILFSIHDNTRVLEKK